MEAYLLLGAVLLAALYGGSAARKRRWAPVALLGAAVAAAAASVLVPGTRTARYASIEGCAEGCEVAAGGWPIPWVLDYPGLSPAESVFLMGVPLGLDRPDVLALGADVLVFGAALFAVVAAWTKWGGEPTLP